MKLIRYQSLSQGTAALVATGPAPSTGPAPAPGGLAAVKRWLATPPDQIVACAADLETAVADLGVPVLTPDDRPKVDTGLGLAAELGQGERVVEVLRLSPLLPQAAEATEAFGQTLGSLSALQCVEPAVAQFQRQASGGGSAVAQALLCAIGAVAEGLEADLAQPGLSPEERATLTQDLRALTVPFEAEKTQQAGARARTGRKVARVRAEGDALTAELGYHETLDAIERAETPSLDALRAARAFQERPRLSAQPSALAAKKAGRRGSRRPPAP